MLSASRTAAKQFGKASSILRHRFSSTLANKVSDWTIFDQREVGEHELCQSLGAAIQDKLYPYFYLWTKQNFDALE